MTDNLTECSSISEYREETVSAPTLKYSLRESVFALVFSFAGYFFIKAFIINCPGIGAAIFMILTALAAALLARLSGTKSGKGSRIYFVLTLIFSANLSVTGNGLIMLLDFMFAAITFSLWAFSVNNSDWRGIDDSFIYSFARALFGQSFGNFVHCPTASAELIRRSKGGKALRNAALGILMAIPVTLLVTFILSSADERFSHIMGSIFGAISIRGIWLYALGLPVSFLVFGIAYGTVKEKSCKRDENEVITKSMKIAPGIMLYTSVIPLCAVYVIFFFSQISYFVSGFAGILPEQFSAAEYARRGFFELCIVAVINLLIIAAMNLFCRYVSKSGENKRPSPLRFFTVLLSVFTLILIATALSKMVMYISRFGLTPKRVYTSWFMIVLAALFALIIARQFKAFNMPRIGVIVFTVMLSLLSFTQTDSIIAEYNIIAYQKGNVESIAFEDLSSDAVYAVAPLLESDDTALKQAALEWYTSCCESISGQNWYEIGFSEYCIR